MAKFFQVDWIILEKLKKESELGSFRSKILILCSTRVRA